MPLEEGLDKVIIKKALAVLEIILTKDEPENKDLVGYQPPLDENLIEPRRRFRRRNYQNYRDDDRRRRRPKYFNRLYIDMKK